MKDIFYLCVSIGVIVMIYIGISSIKKSEEVIETQRNLTSQIEQLFNITSGFENIKYLYLKTD